MFTVLGQPPKHFLGCHAQLFGQHMDSSLTGSHRLPLPAPQPEWFPACLSKLLPALDSARRYAFEQMNPEGPFTQVAIDGDTICGHVTVVWSATYE